MVRVRLVPKEEAQQTRRSKEPGPRRQRMNQFDMYASSVLDNPAEAAVYEELGEEPQKFVMSLRGSLKRAGVDAVVRKMRGRDEVRAWLKEPPEEPVAAGKTRGRGRGK
jgi:hypothetical protein